MKIIDMVCSKGRTGFFFDDQMAIKTNAVKDGNAYRGYPVTPGFQAVRQAGEAVSIMLILEDGQVAYGDCAAVQYSGAAGRDPLFLADDFIPIIEEVVRPVLVGREITNFRAMAKELDALTHNGKHLHTAIRYGVTQAALDAVAKSKHKLMAQIVADEYEITISDRPIPIFSQSGDEPKLNADKMILKQADILPHALFNNVDKVGFQGHKLLEYVKWLRNRIFDLRADDSYNPIIHLDVYGTIGVVFDHSYDKMADFLQQLEYAAAPLKVRVEGPVDMGDRDTQVLAMMRLRQVLEMRGIGVELVADEWCNTLEDIIYFTENRAGHMVQIKTPDLGGINNSIKAVLYCQKNGMDAYLGGTCNETERSAQVCTHIAMAVSPVQMLAKPGMGMDEGYMIVYNEMQRILALKDRV
ncbi:MAG: methylaspartate ammonia-lyase [Defluviitaleaceae bacterium]|nr:methylaspartate ammonia-lyase [Defluviitaleaceae bacterium]